MRPASIIRFEQLYLASIALAAVNSALLLSPAAGYAPPGEASGLIGFVATSLAVSLLLWFFAARRASRIAKWLMVALFVLGAAGLPAILSAGPLDIPAVLTVVTWGLQAAAIWMLFRPDAAAWFKGRGREGAATGVD